jgi:hypothetical protein
MASPIRFATICVAFSILLSGCALLPSAVKPVRVATVPAVVDPHPLVQPVLAPQIRSSLSFAHARQELYLRDYNRLIKEQGWRDGAILAAGVGLSATAIFRGDANSLKAAGFFSGLSTFYDKVVPLKDRIAAANTTFNNFNALFIAGNNLLYHAIDVDAKSLNDDGVAVKAEIAKADDLLSQSANALATACPGAPASTPAPTTKALKAQLTAVEQQATTAVNCLNYQAKLTKSATALTNTVAAAQTSLDASVKATNALAQAPQVVLATTNAIDNQGRTGVALSFDGATAGGGFTAAPAPKATGGGAAQGKPPLVATGQATPPATLGPDPAALDAEAITLKLKTATLQAMLDTVDYVALVQAIADTAPKAATPPPTPAPAAKTNASASPAPTS